MPTLTPITAISHIDPLCANYSGVVIDQNAEPTTGLDIGNEWWYQTFRLPEDYPRGEFINSGEFRYPGLSGFQILIDVPVGEAPNVQLNFALDQFAIGQGWTERLAKGTVYGCHTDGEKVWLDVIFDKEVPVTEAMANTDVAEPLRIGFQALTNVEKAWYRTPNPYHGKALHEDEKTVIEDASFDFRILALVADSGTDFLGNPYRSVAIHSNSEDPVSGHSNEGYWLSSPQPSQFAVVSYYADVRPFPETPTYGTVNRITDPSFEYDKVGDLPFGWSLERPEPASAEPPVEEIAPHSFRQPLRVAQLTFASAFREPFAADKTGAGEWQLRIPAHLSFAGGFRPFNPAHTARVVETEPFKGNKCLEVNTGTNAYKWPHEREGIFFPIEVSINKPITFSGWVRTNSSGFQMAVIVGDETVGYAETEFTVNTEWTRWSVTLTPKESGFTSVGVVVQLSAASKAHIFFIDAMMINSGTKAVPYIDGDQPSIIWENERGRSESIELIEPTVEDDEVVIDSLLVDPLTPGVSFNVYYSNDMRGSETGEPMTEANWEQKLWTHVPRSFVTSNRTTYALPEPIAAKFMKVEFSHLQAKPYEPGDLQKPTVYKLFPDWVSIPFLAEVTIPQFIAKKTAVSFDALELAYKPVIEDLIEAPTSPEVRTIIKGPAESNVDPATLAQVNLVLNTYLHPPAAQGDRKTLLGLRTRENATGTPNYPVEEPPEFVGSLTPFVSTLNRQAIVLDQSTPVMFFWVTCRHEYKELAATFPNNRAYFAGLNDIAFIRNTYTTENDGELYIETGIDDINTDRNDFVIEDANWFAY